MKIGQYIDGSHMQGSGACCWSDHSTKTLLQYAGIDLGLWVEALANRCGMFIKNSLRCA